VLLFMKEKVPLLRVHQAVCGGSLQEREEQHAGAPIAQAISSPTPYQLPPVIVARNTVWARQ
jgi:hypothetical protein